MLMPIAGRSRRSGAGIPGGVSPLLPLPPEARALRSRRPRLRLGVVPNEVHGRDQTSLLRGRGHQRLRGRRGQSRASSRGRPYRDPPHPEQRSVQADRRRPRAGREADPRRAHLIFFCNLRLKQGPRVRGPKTLVDPLRSRYVRLPTQRLAWTGERRRSRHHIGTETRTERPNPTWEVSMANIFVRARHAFSIPHPTTAAGTQP